jgi:large conductance mechanosensitive channel
VSLSLAVRKPGWLAEFGMFIARGNGPGCGHCDRRCLHGAVNSLVKDVTNPLIGLALGRVDFSNVFVALNGQHYSTLAAAQGRGHPDRQPKPVQRRD